MTLILAVLATLFWALVVVLYATDDEFRRDLEDSGGSGGTPSTLQLAAVLGRLAWSLVA